MEWRPKGWNNPQQLPTDWMIFEAGADAIMLALWNMAKAQPDGILRLNSNEVGEGLRFEV